MKHSRSSENLSRRSAIQSAFATIGMAVRKGDADTKDAVSKALAAIKADGVLDALLKKYGMPASSKLD